jgi:hypothetical protein
MKRRVIGIAILFIFAMMGCDDSFSPKAPFQPRMVIYSVLSAESDTQFVRIYSTYDSPNNDPTTNLDEKPVTDATVTISDGATTYALRDTVIPRPDKSRYLRDIHAYYVYPFRPQPNRTYKLLASSPVNGAAEATLKMPGHGSISVLSPSLLADPWFGEGSYVSVQLGISPNTKGFRVLFFVEYEGFGAKGWEVHRREVPASMITVNCLYLEYAISFPKVVGRLTPLGRSGFEGYAFGRFAYRRSVEIIRGSYYDIRFRNAVFYLIQFDENLYNNYQTANAYQDRYSTRLDERDFTNVKDGLGVFGGFTVDSLYYQIPQGMRPSGDVDPCR